MAVTAEFIKKELMKLGKKEQANEMTRTEALETLEQAKSIDLNLQHEKVALRTLAIGGVPKTARPALAQQLAEAFGVDYDEASIMELITKYEKQDTTAEPAKPAKPSKAKVEAEAPEKPAKKMGRPKMSDEEKADRARQRALAAAETAAMVSPAVEDDPDDEYFDPDTYEDE